MIRHKSDNKNKVKGSLVSSNDNAKNQSVSVGAQHVSWGGSISCRSEHITSGILQSFKADRRFYSIALESTQAQIKAHMKRKLIKEADGRAILSAIEKIKEMSSVQSFDSLQFGDIYDYIEQQIISISGKSGHVFCVGRSREDQIAGDIRSWVRGSCDNLEDLLQALQASLIDKTEEHIGLKTVIPYYSYSQIQQPIYLGHQLMSYVEMFVRDRCRFKEIRKRANQSSYGSNMVGTILDLNRDAIARSLHFDDSTYNSIDSTTDYDHILEFLGAVNICGVHISKFIADVLTWLAPSNNFISLSDAIVVQNICNPLKRDPRVLEAIRAKVGKLLGLYTGVHAIANGLSSGVSQDIHEAVNSLIDSYDAVTISIKNIKTIVDDFVVNRKEVKEASQANFPTAPDVVDWLVMNLDITTQRAAEVSANIVKLASAKNTKLSLLPLDELQKIEPRITKDIYTVLVTSRAVINRRTKGGSSPVQIRKAIRNAKRAL
ncbi:argininosuccinate lyase [Rickettsiales endosymbiont of Peranema trichophorum]|uniref:argininosuccinate lyase n=1 Tax=Rickettsiales endosymbiont of Peranema trichophorum TaxID=2486577 RepID=UPI001022D493|nr:argininosuccinate lyase [Rickettsiales endosymbiont of Peranema trichophorum]RZI45166.1 argininosuccinate lyase [Rickettsiales endosymbiont of Peranema trichophorum]